MFGSLFGADMPLAVRFFLAFVIVLGLIGVTAWAVRRFGGSRLGGGSLRGRQPRLGVIDYASVDARRRLILVRRDNVEHLVMIGGPTDIVVESNIVRAVPAARDVPLARPPVSAETLPRAIPLPEAGNGSWPLQPEPTPPRRSLRVEPIAEGPENFALPPTEPPQPAVPPSSRPQREVLSALAEDLAAALPTPPTAPVPPAITAATPARSRTQPPRSQQVETRAEPRAPAPATPVDTAAADQSLADMAQRLEAALRKPKASEQREGNVAASPRSAPEPASETETAAVPPPPPRPSRPPEAKPTRADAKAKESKLYDTLEQEMASLLGRPPGKT